MNETMLLWGFGLFALGFLLLSLELFIPSGGILGVMAALSGIAGVVAFFRFSAGWGMTSLGALLILAPVSVAFLIKVWPHTAVGRRMILGSPGTEEAEHLRADSERRRSDHAALESLIGTEGEALTDLRPVGEALIAGQRRECLAHGPAIEKGARVRVSGVEGFSLRVRAV